MMSEEEEGEIIFQNEKEPIEFKKVLKYFVPDLLIACFLAFLSFFYSYSFCMVFFTFIFFLNMSIIVRTGYIFLYHLIKTGPLGFILFFGLLIGLMDFHRRQSLAKKMSSE